MTPEDVLQALVIEISLRVARVKEPVDMRVLKSTASAKVHLQLDSSVLERLKTKVPPLSTIEILDAFVKTAQAL